MRTVYALNSFASKITDYVAFIMLILNTNKGLPLFTQP